MKKPYKRMPYEYKSTVGKGIEYGVLYVDDLYIPEGHIYTIPSGTEATVRDLYLEGRLMVRGILYVTGDYELEGTLDLYDYGSVELGV